MSFLLKTIILYFFLFPSLGWAIEEDSSSAQADQLETQAVDLIDNDQMTEGMALMKQAVDIDPTPMRHMNYGSILFGNGVVDYKNGNKEQGLHTLYEAQDELAQAISGFNPRKEGVFIAQAYFLLGEMYLNAFDNPTKAKIFYRKALLYYPNQGARSALQKLNKKQSQFGD